MEEAIAKFLAENDELVGATVVNLKGMSYLYAYNTWDERNEEYEFFHVPCGDIHVERNGKFIGAY